MEYLRDGSHPADLVVLEARIFTCGDKEWAEAVAVKDERITYVGTNKGVMDYIGPHTRVIDAKGKVLVPGFIDNHTHTLWLSSMYGLMENLNDAKNFDQMKAKIINHAQKNPQDPFVMGFGWKYDYIPNSFPDKSLADTIMADRPLFLWAYDGHTGWVNSMALEMMQKKNPEALKKLTPELDKDTGEMTGLFLHCWSFNPFDYFSYDEFPKSEQKMFERISKIHDEAISVGVTTVNDIQLYKNFFPLVEKFKQNGGLDKIRVRGSYHLDHYCLQDEGKLKQELIEWKELAKSNNGPNLYLGDSVKLYIDGICCSYTSFMYQPYSDRPAEYGHPLWSQEDFNRVMEILDSMEIQACTHGIGDAGINRIINSYEHVQQLSGKKDMRHRIEHCELPTFEDIKRMGELGIYASMQPTHLYIDKKAEDAIGDERLQRFMPWKSMEKAKVNISFGTDWCIAPINPLYGLLLTATRLNYKGETDWGPEEKISLENAIRHYTIGSARALKLDKDIGSIEVGKYADFVLFEESPLEITSWWFGLTRDLELGGLDDLVIMTVLGGKIVYHKKGTKF